MAELKLERGDYVPDCMGGLRTVEGQEAIVQRVLYKLTARRGQFPFLEKLGSRLWQLGQVPARQRQTAAEQYVAEALSDEKELAVETVTLTPGTDGRAALTVVLLCGETRVSVTADIQ